MADDNWAPHAEKEFGRFTHALSKTFPAKLTQVRRTGRRIRALAATSHRRVRG
jgi:hypothetical protein